MQVKALEVAELPPMKTDQQLDHLRFAKGGPAIPFFASDGRGNRWAANSFSKKRQKSSTLKKVSAILH